MIRKILVALDGSTQAGKALDLALAIAKAFDSEFIVIHVISDQPLTESERRLAENEYQAEVQQALSGPEFITSASLTPRTAESLTRSSYNVGVAVRTAMGRRIVDNAVEHAESERVAPVRTMLRDGDPASVIVEAADEEKPDLLIMGSRGLGGIQRLLIGSVSQKVSTSAKCTVVLVK
jgi:nucleotide-binding universal stress UspA family protein